MNPVNDRHIPIPLLREMFLASLVDVTPGDISRNIASLDFALTAISANFKLIHPLLISRYAKVISHHSDKMFRVIGLDIETEATTGEPKLLGYAYPDGYYFETFEPSLEDFFRTIKSISDNDVQTNIVAWGNLDINCLIRLFDPTPDEREQISSGISGNFSKGDWIAKPPLLRTIGDSEFYIDHYISGRSLRLGIRKGRFASNVWIYNASQFNEANIAETAKASGYDWIDYDRNTHIVDWERYLYDREYHDLVIASNKQDAITVRRFAEDLGKRFYNVFKAYPKLLVSTGSLADAAVSKMLNPEDYASNSWRHLRYTAFADSPHVDLAESILSEAYSAGYVDQFGIGYFDKVHTADISSAYPHKIRQLPDLRNFQIFAGVGDPTEMLDRLTANGWRVFTAAIRGEVYIPEHLKYHPITIKTKTRQNIRPTGTFKASYLLEERDYCVAWGSRFKNETWTMFATKDWKLAPIAGVSEKLAIMRDDYRRKMKDAATDEESLFYDGMQFMVKVVDNSLYGKTVMATSIVEDIDGKPTITGYKAGDRFNHLYGAWITATTRIQIAEACMQLEAKGSKPIVAMTDSIYWYGDKNHLDVKTIAKVKTAGYFEPPSTVEDFYVIKTGQYEYRVGNVWYHKVRGLNIPYNQRSDSESLFRRMIKEWLKDKSPYMHAEDVEIPVETRKLVTIGMTDLENLGLIKDGIALMKPFVLSGKQVENYVSNWQDAIDNHVWLKFASVNLTDGSDTPLEFLSGLHESGGNYLNRHERKRMFFLLTVKHTGNVILPKRLSNMSWDELESWSGIKREWCKL